MPTQNRPKPNSPQIRHRIVTSWDAKVMRTILWVAHPNSCNNNFITSSYSSNTFTKEPNISHVEYSYLESETY